MTLCKQDGADISTVSSKPLSFTALVAELERVGVLSPTIDPKVVPGSSKPALENQEAELSANFEKEVKIWK